MKEKPLFKRLILIIEIIVLFLMMQFVLTDGFSKTISENFGITGEQNLWSVEWLIGSPDLKRIIISIIIITISFVIIVRYQKKKKR